VIVSVKLFAIAAEKAQAESVVLVLPEPATIADLRSAFSEKCPALQPLLKHFHFAVDAEFATDFTPITSHSEVACIPPVSGG